MWRFYRKLALQEMRPYVVGEDMTWINVSAEDTPEEGGMIARNAKHIADQWYVAKKVFEADYEIAEPKPDTARGFSPNFGISYGRSKVIAAALPVTAAEHAPITEIRALISELRAVAEPVGSLHAYWDIIVDLEECLACQALDIDKRAEYARKVLAAKLDIGVPAPTTGAAN